MQSLLRNLGPVTAIIGAQWGDEGKGKIVDILAEHFDVLARACGGANAGHTIVIGGKKHVFHLLPAGCLHPGKKIFLGAGMVIHLPTLMEEISIVEDSGIPVIERLSISSRAHIVFDYHREIDAALERMKDKDGKALGTTKRGIGPAYMDKAGRTGMTMLPALHMQEQALKEELRWRAQLAEKMYGVTVDIPLELKVLKTAATKLLGCVDREHILDVLDQRKSILIEGAQATLLDIDHGTYPFVTSSSTTAAGALQGLGLPPKALTSCIGVAKSYCTRVGGGPFPTEADPETSLDLRERGGEYGATTGRPRRCGWLHVPDLLYAHRINGFTYWNITKLDVLDERATIKVGMDFSETGETSYEELPGWKESSRGITSFMKLPKKAKKFIEFIEEKTAVPVAFIGTGPGREEMIVREE